MVSWPYSNFGKITMQPSSPSVDPSGSVRRAVTIVLLIAAVALPCAVIYMASSPAMTSFPSSFRWKQTLPFHLPPAGDDVVDLDNEQVRLEKVLKEAAMKDKTVILITLNSAWASPNSILDLFIQSFRIGNGTRELLDHLVMIALDKKAYACCVSLHPYCFALSTDGVDFSGEKDYMSSGYLKMMWRRTDFLRQVLEMGYNFIFSDTDIMWFRNPIPHFYPDGDFQIACDHFMGNEFDINNRPNGGYLYVKSNNRTVQFYKYWYSSREKHPGLNEQDVLNIIKYHPYIREIGLKMRFLSTAYFGGLCEPSRDFNKVCTMHANCCIGLNRKIHDLSVMLDDWRKFLSMPPELRRSKIMSWSVPQNCSLAPVHH